MAAAFRLRRRTGGRLEGDRRPISAPREAGSRHGRPDPVADAGFDGGGGRVGAAAGRGGQGARRTVRCRDRGGDRRDRHPQRHRSGTRRGGGIAGRRHRPPESPGAGASAEAGSAGGAGADPAAPGAGRAPSPRDGTDGPADAARAPHDPDGGPSLRSFRHRGRRGIADRGLRRRGTGSLPAAGGHPAAAQGRRLRSAGAAQGRRRGLRAGDVPARPGAARPHHGARPAHAPARRNDRASPPRPW
ncbi:UNVERIFIED_ORG: hypothetical protein M2438_000967 [Methylobacterium sp. SuP10 SLI 274]|nr:hypothetical protein [Methylobacterium sp. SuP10 SLI 274]